MLQQRGFTLLEALVVVIIMGILAAVAAPYLGTWMDNVRIRNTAESLQQGLQAARGEAIKRNQNISFWLMSPNGENQLDNSCDQSHTSTAWVVSITAPDKRCGDSPSLTSAPRIVTKRDAIGGAVAVTAKKADNSAATSVTFNGFGRLVGTDAITRIEIDGPQSNTNYRSLHLMISPAGQVRSCDPNAGSTDPRAC